VVRMASNGSGMETFKLLMKSAPTKDDKKLVLELQLKKSGSPSCDALIAELIKDKVLDASLGFGLLKETTEKAAAVEQQAKDDATPKKKDPMAGMKEAAENAKQALDTKLKQLEQVSTMRKKILVSGCFDLLHSGHVEFFQQAAQLGDLYVYIGSDKNIESLKHHKSMYSEHERLYMVKSIKGVKDAKVSQGMGRFDFLDDIKDLRPDVYFVNDDASKLEERTKLVEDLNICKVVVAPRKPAEGLEERSSTSMKARLRDMVLQDARCKCFVKCFV